MDSNPYKSPTATNEPLKVRSRVKRALDALAIIFAGLPLLPYFLFLLVISPRILNDVADKYAVVGVILTVVSWTILVGYPVSAVYNLVGVIGSRRTAYYGLAMNVATIAIYAVGYFVDWSAWRLWN